MAKSLHRFVNRINEEIQGTPVRAGPWPARQRAVISAYGVKTNNENFLAAIHAVIPRNAERAGLDAHNHRVARAKAIVIVEIYS